MQHTDFISIMLCHFVLYDDWTFNPSVHTTRKKSARAFTLYV